MMYRRPRLLEKGKQRVHIKRSVTSSPLNNIAFSGEKRQIGMDCGLISSPEKSASPADLAKHKANEESHTAFLGEAVEFSPSQTSFGTGTVTRLGVSRKTITAPIVRIRSMCYYFSGGSPPKSRFYMFVPQSYGEITVETQEIPSIEPRMLFAACEYKKLYLIHGGLTSYWNTHSKVDSMKVDAIDPFTYKTSEIKLTGDYISPRYSHHLCKISDCKAILYGGIGKRKLPCGDAFIIDFDAETVTCISKPPMAVGGVGSALIEEVVYFFGGLDQRRHYNTLFYYDLATGQWGERVLKSISPRRGASLLGFGSNLLIVGGRNDWDIFNDVWVVDPKSFEPQRLSLSGDMFSGRSGASCVQVTSNSFLLIGGHAPAISMDQAYLIALT